MKRKHTLTKSRVVFVLSATAISMLIASCGGPKMYLAGEFETYRQTHQRLAILPFNVMIDPKKLPKDFTLEMAKEAEKDESYNIQEQLYMRFLDREQKGKYTVKFQDVDDTNARLGKAGIDNENLGNYTKAELKEILEVDALISGTIFRERPMSTGTAIVLGAIFGIWGSTNKVNVTLNIHDAASGELLWKYEHEASGSVGSSSVDLAESLMKSISKKFPYKRPKDS